SSVIISYPGIPGLNQEDVADVATYLGIPVFEGNHGYPPHTITAAYAGYGMGLCKSFEDREKCWKEELNLPVRRTLLVESSDIALLLNGGYLEQAHEFGESFTHFDFGYLDLAKSQLSDPEGFAEIRDSVTEVVRNMHFSPHDVRKEFTVILTGSSSLVNENIFKKAVTDGIKKAGAEFELLDKRPDYMASRGAAELAWRSFML
ncbi:hypothetical protein DM02DRAFT_485381, partial [Periconia macrospinosa]